MDQGPTSPDSAMLFQQVLDKLSAIESRLTALEARGAGVPAEVTDLLAQAPHIIATAADVLDDEVAVAASGGLDVDRAVRNGLRAALQFGKNISPQQLDALDALLASDALHPEAIAVVGRLGCALASAARQPAGSTGLFGALGALRDERVRRSLAFVLNVARALGDELGQSSAKSGAQR